MSTQNLSDRERFELAEVADLFIPASESMPSASQARVHTDGIDRVLTVRDDLLAGVRLALDDLSGRIPHSFDELRANPPLGFAQLAEAVTAAYFLNPDVARSVGYTTRSEIPIIFDTDLDVLVSAVSARGPIYRPTPGVPSSNVKAATR